jgi:hypothetical protein
VLASALLAIVAAMSGGCSKPPTEEMLRAEKSVAGARDRHAQVYAPDELAAVDAEFGRARDLVAARKYDEARIAAARVEELAQLEVADIKQDYGHDYLDITIIDNAPDRKKDPIEHAKSLKNANARREVPLHPDLITLGFLDYVEEMRRAGKRRVFPLVQAYRGRSAKNIGRWLNRLIDKHVSARSEFVFHSFRHVLANELRNRAPQAGVLDKVINGLVGHAGGEVSDKYGLPHALRARQHAVNLFGIEGLELSKFKRPGSGC